MFMFFFIASQVFCSIRFVSFHVFERDKTMVKGIYNIVYSRSNLECLIICASESLCKTVNFYVEDGKVLGRCELNTLIASQSSQIEDIMYYSTIYTGKLVNECVVCIVQQTIKESSV